ncbi:MAG: translation initiation factor IF-2 N-terminal domain-containing protein [Planctomycetota bacterium]
MAKTTRVHLLAKELNVKSKAIVEKCQAEGLDQIKMPTRQQSRCPVVWT